MRARIDLLRLVQKRVVHSVGLLRGAYRLRFWDQCRCLRNPREVFDCIAIIALFKGLFACVSSLAKVVPACTCSDSASSANLPNRRCSNDMRELGVAFI